ncbi:MAG: hypothetical protein WCK18_11335 [Prolixibacteraceae bacterium]
MIETLLQRINRKLLQRICNPLGKEYLRIANPQDRGNQAFLLSSDGKSVGARKFCNL